MKSLSASTVHGPGRRNASRGTVANASTRAGERSLHTASSSSAKNRRLSAMSGISFLLSPPARFRRREPLEIGQFEVRELGLVHDDNPGRALPPFVDELARSELGEPDFFGFGQSLQDGVNRGQAAGVLREVEADRPEPVADLHGSHRATR